MEIAKGLEGIAFTETRLSLVDGKKGQLVIRGYWAKTLAVKFNYEHTVYLLLHGKLPNAKELQDFKSLLESHRELPTRVKMGIEQMDPSSDMMSVIRTGVSLLTDSTFTYPPTIEQAISIIAKVPTMIAHRNLTKAGRQPIAPKPGLGHAANYLYMLTGKEPTPAQARALDAYFILTSEHGMNASTFAARVCISTQSDLVSAICAGIGTLKGPLHGGAPTGVSDMLVAIQKLENAENWVRGELNSGRRLMGFGHRVYKTEDPRASALRDVAMQVSAQDPLLKLAVDVEKIALRVLEEHKPGRGLRTNVEYYAAVVMRAVGLPKEVYPATFALSRTSGWCANAIEQAENNRLIRPTAKYIGLLPEGFIS